MSRVLNWRNSALDQVLPGENQGSIGHNCACSPGKYHVHLCFLWARCSIGANYYRSLQFKSRSAPSRCFPWHPEFVFSTLVFGKRFYCGYSVGDTQHPCHPCFCNLHFLLGNMLPLLESNNIKTETDLLMILPMRKQNLQELRYLSR